MALAGAAAGGRLEWVVARLTSVCGPGAYRSWRSLHESILRKQVTLIGAADQPIHVVDVDDACQALVRCLAQPGISGRTYLVAGPDAMPLRSFCELFAVAAGVELHARRLPAWPLSTLLHSAIWLADRCGSMPTVLHSADFLLSARAFDISRARSELGYAPDYNTMVTVARTLRPHATDTFRSEANPL
jgi:nucleoside-diphosphate-sugar epimerase